jgi:hypothetical protein
MSAKTASAVFMLDTPELFPRRGKVLDVFGLLAECLSFQQLRLHIRQIPVGVHTRFLDKDPAPGQLFARIVDPEEISSFGTAKVSRDFR